MGQRRFFPYDNLLQKITVWSAFVVLGWSYVETGITSLMDLSGKSQCQFLNLSIILLQFSYLDTVYVHTWRRKEMK